SRRGAPTRLVALPTRLYTGRRPQPDLVAQRLQLPAPMVRPTARLHPDHGRLQLGEELLNLNALQLPTDHHLPSSINPVNLENALRQIQSNHDSLHSGRLLCLVLFALT